MNIPNTIVTLEADKPFQVEITGSKDAKTAIILVHGFGVKRDSRGMFLEIENEFLNQFLCVRGDFTEINEDHSRAIPITIQTQYLQKIVQYIEETYSIKRFIFVGHSQGCIVVANAHPTKSKVILLAPPVNSPAERFAQTPGWKRPGSVINEEGESKLIRSDGSITIVPSEFWKDFQSLDVDKLYKELNQNNTLIVIFAGSDQVLGVEKAPEGIEHETIEGADHDFKGGPRKVLIQKLKELVIK